MKYFSLIAISFIFSTLVYSISNFINQVETNRQLTEQKVVEDEENARLELEKFNRDLACLASVVYHEARGEPFEGQTAVAQVVLNRVRSRHFPASVCEVAFQPHQFTGLSGIKYNKKTFDVALKVYTGTIKNKTTATHFHAYYVEPSWASSKKKVFLGRIGNHLFYRATWA